MTRKKEKEKNEGKNEKAPAKRKARGKRTIKLKAINLFKVPAMKLHCSILCLMYLCLSIKEMQRFFNLFLFLSHRLRIGFNRLTLLLEPFNPISIRRKSTLNTLS